MIFDQVPIPDQHDSKAKYDAASRIMGYETRVATAAALSAGKYLKTAQAMPLAALGKCARESDARDFVTQADVEAEALILSVLSDSFPEYGFLAEEGGDKTRQGLPCWIIDPLDGTLNYMHGLPFYAVSIGLEVESEIVVGVVYNPTSDELFWAEKGRGAYRWPHRINVSSTTKLSDAILACTIDKEAGARLAVLNTLTQFGTAYKSLICLQASSIALALLADGKIDALVDYGRSWDFAAGQLIATEAGALASEWRHSPPGLSRYLLAANPPVHAEMERLISSATIAA